MLSRSVITCVFFLAYLVVLAGCASNSRLYANNVPNGSIRLLEVVRIAKRAEVLEMPNVYANFTAWGISDGEIWNGSVATGRAYCCGGSPERDVVLFFVAQPLAVELGDVVEVWSGAPAKGNTKPTTQPNTAFKVHPKLDSRTSQCRWEPEDPKLKLRVLHCDWMASEGWIQQDDARFPVWIKHELPRNPSRRVNRDTDGYIPSRSVFEPRGVLAFG